MVYHSAWKDLLEQFEFLGLHYKSYSIKLSACWLQLKYFVKLTFKKIEFEIKKWFFFLEGTEMFTWSVQDIENASIKKNHPTFW